MRCRKPIIRKLAKFLKNSSPSCLKTKGKAFKNKPMRKISAALLKTFFKNAFYSNFNTSDLEENSPEECDKNKKNLKYIKYVKDVEIHSKEFFHKE